MSALMLRTEKSAFFAPRIFFPGGSLLGNIDGVLIGNQRMRQKWRFV